MEKQYLVEMFNLEINREQLAESIKNNSGKLVIEGVIQRAEEKNANGRTYPKEILEREINRYITEFVDQGRAVGELDHPEDSVAKLKNACINIEKIWWDGNDVKGRIKVLSTPTGNIVRNLIEDGIKIGISSRGLGSVKQNEGKTVVQDDYFLVCWDIVSDPSTQGAFVGAVNESKSIRNKDINLVINSILAH